MIDVKERARAAMLGLALGDSLSWPAMYHRSYLLPFWTRRIRREMDAASEATNVIRLPMPFSLSQPADAFEIAPSDDTEWASFTANLLLMHDGELDFAKILHAWEELANSAEPVHGGVSTQAALRNLRKGILPPQSGHDNPHYFDDGAMCSAVPIGIVSAGNPSRAAELAALEAAVTNAEDGVWAAQAVAASVSVACAGGSVDEVVSAAGTALPGESWIQRMVESAVATANHADSLLAVVPKLSNEIINKEYSYGAVAPETLALTLAILKITGRDFDSALMGSLAFAKTADSVPALVGALAGALSGVEIDFQPWEKSIRYLKGICLPNSKGKDFIKLTEQLADLADRKFSKMKT